LLPLVFRAVVFKLLVWCGAEGYVSALQDVALLYFRILTTMHGQNHIKFVVSKFVSLGTVRPGHETVANCYTQFIKAVTPHL